MLTQDDKKRYDCDGFVVKKSMYSKKEVEKLLDIAQKDDVLKKHTYGRKDQEGNTTKLALWYSLDDNIYSAFARSERMVNGVQMLLEGPPCHFHTKLMQKEPRVGGAWEWHQDYGYWYHDGFLYPYMMSVMIALTAATKENGCLQVIRGSHKIERINHGKTGDQKGADQAVVEEVVNRLGYEYVPLEPGDALFFHGNILHRSDKNDSENPRWSMISVFNRIDNPPYKDQNPSCQTPVRKIPDDKILEISPSGIEETSDFLN